MPETPKLTKSPKEILQDVLQSDVDQFTQHYDTFTSEEVADYLQNVDISDLDRSTKVTLSEIMDDLVINLMDIERLRWDDELELELESFIDDVTTDEDVAGFNELHTAGHKHLDEKLLAVIAKLRTTILALQSYEISEKEIVEHIEKKPSYCFSFSIQK